MKKEILVQIEKALPFNATVYPQFDRLLPDEQKVFAMRHMLTHQLKSLMPYRGANDTKRTELACELAFNGFRLAQVAGLSEHALNQRVGEWERLNRAKAPSRRRLEEENIALLDKGTRECLVLFEPVDHGRKLSTIQAQLRTNAAHFLELSRELAKLQGLTLSDLSTWIGQFMVKHPT